MNTELKIRVGSRKSELALIQTNYVISLLKNLHPTMEFEIVTMNTLGDEVLNIPLPKIGEKSLFTRELETALATSCVDFVVHSLKDLPTSLPEHMAIGAVLERMDPRDAIVLHKDLKNYTLETLPKGSIIGTSSLRRTAQFQKNYPHLKVENIRGNLNTRLKKLDDLNKFQAIILATAGLQRMGWNNRISKILDDENILYAVGQGALAVECRETDTQIISLLKPLYDVHTAIRIIVERTFLKILGGGCSAPVAVKTDLVEIGNCKHKLSITGAVWLLDGSNELREKSECEIQINNNIFCTECPYRNSIDTTNCDIECLHTKMSKNSMIRESGSCLNTKLVDEVTIDQTVEQKPCKRMKLSHNKDISDDISIQGEFENTPDKCPINLPVGVDFMGKCPYLETHTVSKCPANEYVDGLDKLSIQKCPYMKAGNTILKDENKHTEINNDNLFCGLVPHPDIPINIYQKAENLGRELAEKLIARGADNIMAKAQAAVRNI